MKKILVLSHISKAYAPTFPFLKFLKKQKDIELDYILHPLINADINKSVYETYNDGDTSRIKQREYQNAIKTLDYLRHFILNLKWIFFSKKKYNIAFGLNNLNAFSCLILKIFRKVDKTVFYTVDYSTRRFDNIILNKLYHLLDSICVKYCDYTLNVSDRIRAVRRKHGLSEKRNLLQPNGVHLAEIKQVDVDRKSKNKMVYVGYLTKSKGIHLIIQALKQINNSQIKLDIIGDGPYKDELEQMVSDFKLKKTIKFLGSKTNKEVLNMIGFYGIGIALYTLDDEFNYYCDPVKIKEYLGARCVVIVSDVPEIANIIENNKLGIKVKNNIKDIKEAIVKLTSDSNIYNDYLNHVINYKGELDWDKLFVKNFNLIIKSKRKIG